jgi:nucleoside-diphosphate-sugar epimerase
MRVLVTGAAGFLGRRITQELRADFDLTVTDIVEPHDLPESVTWRSCDITDEAAVGELVAGHDAIVHTVAIVRGREGLPIAPFLSVTVGGTWNVLDAAARSGVSRVVNISSVSAAGQPDPEAVAPYGADVSGALHAGDIRYGLSKRLGETIADAYAASFPGLAVVNLRPVMIAGDGANPEPSPQDERRFLHVDVADLARSVRHALETSPAPMGAYAITAARDDSTYSWREAERALGFVARQNWPEIPGSVAGERR